MRTSIVLASRSLLLAAILCAAAATASVPTEVTISGKVTGLDSQSIQIDGVAYALESSVLTRAALSDVRVGDPVTIAISPRRAAATPQNSNPVSAGHEVVHAATASTESTVRVIHQSRE